MSLAVSMFRWLDLLEKEFDKAFIELDVILGNIDCDQSDLMHDGRKKLTVISSVFSQLSHKSQTIYENNAKYEAELVGMRSELSQARATITVLEKEAKNLLLQLHAVQLQLHLKDENTADLQLIKAKLENDLTQFRQSEIKESQLMEEAALYKKENDGLRKYITQLQGEVCGARLAAKYLDKELAGRIQQIQLLGRDLKMQEHEMLWNQIESEIFLHRHKTVIRACKRNHNKRPINSTETSNSSNFSNEMKEALDLPLKKQPGGELRIVKFHRKKSEGLGISITGGKEHGVPVIISEIHEGLPASNCDDLHTGDAIIAVNNISLENATHAEAVSTLSTVSGNITMEVYRVIINSSSEDEDWETNYNSRYSSIGLLDDPNEITMDSDINMTNSPAPSLFKKDFNSPSYMPNSLAELKLSQNLRKINEDMTAPAEKVSSPTPVTPSLRYPGLSKRIYSTDDFLNTSES